MERAHESTRPQGSYEYIQCSCGRGISKITRTLVTGLVSGRADHVFSKNPGWDYKKFVADFERSECYQAPLTLEEGGRGTFLETTFELQANGTFRHHLKNENNMGERPKIWRYTDWRSHGRYEQKRALITGRMRAVHKMATWQAINWRSDRVHCRSSTSSRG